MRKQRRYQKVHTAGRQATILLLTLLLVLGGLSVVDRTAEQARLIGGYQSAQDGGDADTPLTSSLALSHGTYLVAFAEEAGGLHTTRSREEVRRAVNAVREAQVRTLYILLFVCIALAALACRSRYIRLPGIFSLSAERVIITYLHDQDGRK